MKKIITIAIALIAGLSAASAQDILGKWKLDDGTAIVEIIRNGNVYDGKIVWLEGDVLKVRGSLDKKGLLGRTMDWFRVK